MLDPHAPAFTPHPVASAVNHSAHTSSAPSTVNSTVDSGASTPSGTDGTGKKPKKAKINKHPQNPPNSKKQKAIIRRSPLSFVLRYPYQSSDLKSVTYHPDAPLLSQVDALGNTIHNFQSSTSDKDVDGPSLWETPTPPFLTFTSVVGGIKEDFNYAVESWRPKYTDTHMHLLSTLSSASSSLSTSQGPPDVREFLKTYYSTASVDKIVDVWCEPTQWNQIHDLVHASAPTGSIGGVEYRYTIGVHPHEASVYNDKIEGHLREHLKHPLCVSLGEIGLDYHYDNSPREVQRNTLRRQLQLLKESYMNEGKAKALTIHTREADIDVWKILKEELKDDRQRRIHIHCYSDTVELAKSLLDYFPNLYIGITGVATYASNTNTVAVLRHLVTRQDSSSKPRFVLETDSPYMIPNQIQASARDTIHVDGRKTSIPRLRFSLSNMIPWTAEFIANTFNEELGGGLKWTTEKVLKIGEENAKFLYNL